MDNYCRDYDFTCIRGFSDKIFGKGMNFQELPVTKGVKTVPE